MKRHAALFCIRSHDWMKIRYKTFGTFKYEWESEETAPTDRETKKTYTRAYGWGLAANGEIGYKELLFPTHHARPLDFTHVPCRIPFSNDHTVLSAACGHGFTVFVRKSKVHPVVFGTGINTNGQLGYQISSGSKSSLSWLVEPAPIALPLRSTATTVSHVACGFGHTLVATDKEGVFALGNNAHGQCGRLPVEREDYGARPAVRRIEDLDPKISIEQIVCGLDHSFVLTKRGRILAFGLGSDGQLGNETFSSNWVPTELKGDIEKEKIVQVSSSGDCCMAVSDKGDLFGWGNSEYKQLSSITGGTMVGIPKRMDLKIGKVKKVAVGGSACVLLTENGEVYTWGYGFLGHGPEIVAKSTPELLPSTLFGSNQYNDEGKVVDIVAGVMNFGAMNSSGELYVWGKNAWGSLGLGHEKEQFFPFRVDLAYKFLSVSMALYHTVAVVKTLR